MISFLGRHRKTIFLVTIFGFLIGTFVGLGAYLFTDMDATRAVAEVGKTKIPYTRFLSQSNQVLDRMRNQGTDVTDDLRRQIKDDVLKEMIVEELLYAEAVKLGIQTTDLELAYDVHNTPAFQTNNNFDQAAYVNALYYLFRMGPKEYEELRRRSLTALKYRRFIYESAKIHPSELDGRLKTAMEDHQKKNKGSSKGFEAEKEKEKIAGMLKQERSIHLLNYRLRQMSSQIPIKSFLEEREKGL
ncbi:MAG: SurA N-terminal domain-containing protein [Elusimicrobia bacterium]|nr:SurA N-terminal domain-containing protein [Elusimicrobiota bacterium]